MADEKTGSRDFYRISCELQIRYRKAEAEEIGMFKNFGLRLSPYTSLRNTIESELHTADLPEAGKSLLERAFQILLNIDQRLERLEELIQHQGVETPTPGQEAHEWIHADVSAGGISFVPTKDKKLNMGDLVMMDMIFPSLPEQRVVCSGKVVHAGQKNDHLGIEFEYLHEEDREFIHRFVLEKEREMLRARALERERSKE